MEDSFSDSYVSTVLKIMNDDFTLKIANMINHELA
jgi:hypothetical protein